MENNNADDVVKPLTPARRCAVCGKPVTARHRSFCSARCSDIDLGRWLKGNYSIPTDEDPEDAGEHDPG
jgi:uncharacterized protein